MRVFRRAAAALDFTAPIFPDEELAPEPDARPAFPEPEEPDAAARSPLPLPRALEPELPTAPIFPDEGRALAPEPEFPPPDRAGSERPPELTEPPLERGVLRSVEPPLPVVRRWAASEPAPATMRAQRMASVGRAVFMPLNSASIMPVRHADK
jgi:hypothetical protein